MVHSSWKMLALWGPKNIYNLTRLTPLWTKGWGVKWTPNFGQP